LPLLSSEYRPIASLIRYGSRHQLRFGSKGNSAAAKSKKLLKKDASMVIIDLNEGNHAKLLFSSVAKYEAARTQLLDVLQVCAYP
jgi:hypothetical protein